MITHEKVNRRWEAVLANRLRALGYQLSVRPTPSRISAYCGFDAVLSAEALRFGNTLASRSESLPPVDTGPAALIIDLTAAAGVQNAPVLTLEIGGRHGIEAGMAQMLSTGQLPDLLTRLDGRVVGRARPMLGDRVWLSRMSDDVLAAAMSLLVQSVGRHFAGTLATLEVAPGPAPARGFLRHYLPSLARGLKARLIQKLRRRRRPFYWQVAYRLIDGPGIAETGRLDGAPFTVLPDDGARFYADPFVLDHGGRHYVFVEEFPYATGRGVISVAELADDGRLGVPAVIIEEPHHLSYPQVFRHAGEIFMIPESSGAREVVLYRADRFPHHWVRDAVLMADIDFNDATLLEKDGRFWLIGTERFGPGSASDTMAVYSAPSLRGPWQPHALNPIAIDRSAARPGGAFIRTETSVLMPVQDGANSYGGGLGLMELSRLDAGDVVFSPPHPIGPGPAWDRGGIHTLNRVGRLEVIDSAG